MTYTNTINDLLNGNIDTGLSLTKQKIWPRYCYHFTDESNLARILRSGRLVSRWDAQQTNSMSNDNANPEVIAGTSESITQNVRLYFRPRTPTLNNNEGFRPGSKYHQASCPFPVFLLFPLAQILNLPNTRFSPTSLALHREPELLSGSEAFSKLPFDLIYHDQAFSPDDRDNIIHHRHAEIVVPHELSLEHLLYIVVRSVAEKETLINLLKLKHLDQYINRVQVDDAGIYFFKRWTYVDEVLMDDEQVNIKMHRGEDAFPAEWTNSDIPLAPENKKSYLNFKIRFQDATTSKFTVFDGAHLVPEHQIINLDTMDTSAYRMIIELNDKLAYYGTFYATKNVPY
ncbi:DarT ssDNA thymidine ADP-ribosyltransferase family protein [Lactiplantibacillus daowaiensis]|uniref:DarT ssDNA thymidine ADP-ribosyltransferase family protein n=1 Tax=Lactiplantibacillus daowaiensis TaxID=2559918 RepID=A0ABW1RWG2_9LACO|nr:DarT ssDNA thymidine ADP-ribosyltransferase family protein [Lactiplantibacillus daowaiensis]